MAALSIPPSGKAFLRYISEMLPKDFTKLKNAIEGMPKGSKADAIEKNIIEQISDISLEPSVIIQQLLSMNMSRFSEKMSAQTFVSEALVAYSEDGATVLPTLGERLIELLDISALIFLAREADVQQECERLYCNARILSDVRPIFDPECTKFIGATIIHNLRIAYHGGDGGKEFFVSLEADDLEKLKKVIERAEIKTKLLRNMMGKTDMMLDNTEDKDHA